MNLTPALFPVPPHNVYKTNILIKLKTTPIITINKIKGSKPPAFPVFSINSNYFPNFGKVRQLL